MEEKINARMFIVGLIAMLLTGTLMLAVFHKVYTKQIRGDLNLTANAIAAAYDKLDDYAELDNYLAEDLRITLVADDGRVLYDSNADITQMDNHMDREEIVQAIEAGYGETVRESGTLGVNTYYYAVKLNDGRILRISMDIHGMYSDYSKLVPMVIVIGILIMALSVGFSQVLTKQLIKPIEAMADNLDEIDKTVPYKELEPFAQAVKKQQIKKAEIGKMRQEFTANVTHELKTPLTSISGYAEMIVSGMVKDEDIINFAGKIHAETGRLIDLISDILNLSELDDPVVPKKEDNVDLYELALNTAEMLSLKAVESGVTITVEGEKAVIKCNRMMLEEMAYNLCDNAIRYNKFGGKVIMRVYSYVDKATFTVIDNGIGISKEHHDRIFERFYRVDKSRSKATGGTGLGLAIVKHIILQHGGKIHIDSEQGQGTIMRVSFKKTEEKNDNV